MSSCSSFAQRNKLHAVRGKKQPISGVRTRSGDLLTLELVVASSVVPMPTLARGKKIPADRLCKMLHVSSLYTLVCTYWCIYCVCLCSVVFKFVIVYLVLTGSVEVNAKRLCLS